MEGLTSLGSLGELIKKKLLSEKYLTPDFRRLSVSDSRTGCAVQPPDKNVLINRSKLLVEKLVPMDESSFFLFSFFCTKSYFCIVKF